MNDELYHHEFTPWGLVKGQFQTEDLEHWLDVVRWDEAAAASGTRPRVLCTADWLDPLVPAGRLLNLLGLVRDTPHLDWMLATRHPKLWRDHTTAALLCALDRGGIDDEVIELIKGWHSKGQPPTNLWLGVAVENQEQADQRIPALLAIPARVRFLSCEPLLGPVDLGLYRVSGDVVDPLCDDCDERHEGHCEDGIHWVIVGGESGRHARPTHPDWVRSLRDQCGDADVPFYFKQWGDWVPESEAPRPLVFESAFDVVDSAIYVAADGTRRPASYGARRNDVTMQCVGVKAAGRRLDGREWSELPR